jgi:DNA invertase Pin-like site-specific DNA recombinase
MSVLGKPVVRAAVYTRKSSDEGLDQEFNSLDAQYEACSAYIASQRHEGWKLIKKRFDDGGISGGTLERLALKALLTDVVDLSRNCAAPLIAYYALKENTDGKQTNSRV